VRTAATDQFVLLVTGKVYTTIDWNADVQVTTEIPAPRHSQPQPSPSSIGYALAHVAPATC
jgi:hypothetical protein